jgi:integrase
MAKFNFNLREPKANTKTPINLVVRWNNNRLVYPTGETIEPKFWEDDKTKGTKYQKAKETKQFPEYPEFNTRLKNLSSMADDTFRRFVNDNKRLPTINELRTIYDKELNPDKEKKLDFFGYFDKFILEAKYRTNPKTKKTFSGPTIITYKNALMHLKDYSKSKNRKIDFDNIDLDFYHDFLQYLTITKSFSENTKGKVVKVVKTVLNDATERGVNTNLSFRSKKFRVMTEEVDNVYLDENELNDIYNLDLTKNSKLERVRDLFIVGCYTGLRFSDLSKANKTNINGKELHIKSIKTAEPIVIPLNKIVLDILAKYEGHFPKAISNQKMNDYLKENICGKVTSLKNKVEVSITKGGLTVIEQKPKYELITTHTARRSFATNCYLNKVPSFVIMGITGHKTESSFIKYIKITPNEKANILEMYLNKNQNLKIVS